MLNVQKHFKKLDTHEIKEFCQKQSLPFSVCCLSIKGNLNMGNMLRTSNIFGANKFIIFGRRVYDNRSAVGSHHYTELERILAIKNIDKTNNISKDNFENELVEFDEVKFIEVMNSNNLTPIFVEIHSDAIKLQEINWNEQFLNLAENKNFCLILGNESTGIPKNIIDTKIHFPGSFVVMIQQIGCINSLNVSNAFSIICYEISNYLKNKIIKNY